jgi:membrane-bound serine protease (ClpP class)
LVSVKWRDRALRGLIAGFVLSATMAAQAGAQTPEVLVAEVDGPITPVIADHLAAAVDAAAGADAVLVVTMDTPGGLDTSMRDIVQTFLNAPIPVVVYVQPEGARAASAGTFITMAAHVAAMAPATSIGAATPIDLQSGETGSEKVINDAVAFAVSVAERRGRNTEFAEDAVRQGTSITSTEAVEQDVADLVAADLDHLLTALDGRSVEVLGEEITLTTAGVTPEAYEMSTFLRLLARIADPNLALLFLSIGTLAVVYEAANPGLGFAGIAGVIMLLLGFFALAVLPVQAAGLALLVLAIALFIGEIFVPGVGVLAAGGTISLILAGIFLFEGEVGVSPPVLWPTALLLGLFTAFAGRAALKARMQPSTTGAGILMGRPVTVTGDRVEGWSAFVEGSWWTVRPATGELESGQSAEVVDIDGLELVVEPRGEEDEH